MKAMTLTQLAERAEVTPRTIRYYIQIGLLPAPGTWGPGAHYDAAYLDRIREIKRLQRAHLPLAKIRQRLDSDRDSGEWKLTHGFAPAPMMAFSAPTFAVREEELTERETSPPAPSRSQWERFTLSPDIELHVRRPLSRRTNRILEEIVNHAQAQLENDEP